MLIIQELQIKINDNRLFVLRDDLYPDLLGGNKCRFADEIFKDLKEKNKDCIITYGDKQSNLNRVIAVRAEKEGIPCFVLVGKTSLDDKPAFNYELIKRTKAHILFSDKKDLRGKIEDLIFKLREKGFNPYYVYGNSSGEGNERILVQAYAKVFDEIVIYEKDNNLFFDSIYLASGTGTTQAGLIIGNIKHSHKTKIIGISIARNEKQGKKAICNNLFEYYGEKKPEDLICFLDKYVIDGYGSTNKDVISLINDLFIKEGLLLDQTYTGKAFWGMMNEIVENKITNSNILFVHTGGTPIFFDDLVNETEVGFL